MSAALATLDDDVRALIQPHVDAPAIMLAAIGIAIASKREEAKQARAASGIEATWAECEDAYLGVDDANRHESASQRWSKSVSIDGAVTTGKVDTNSEHRSTVYLRLTSRYVDAGTAKLGEILLPANDKAFSFSEMPVPHLIAAAEDESQVVHDGMPLTRPLAKGEVAPPPAMPGPPGPVAPSGPAAPAPQPQPRVPLTVKDAATEHIEIARKRAKKAETRIYDWMTQTRYRAEIRKVIHDAARIGVGVLKAPVPKSKKVMAITKARRGGIQVEMRETLVPSACWVDPWDCYPDPACGENIHDGDYFFERDKMSARQVRALKRLPGFIAGAIDKVLEEGPGKCNMTDSRERGAASEGNPRFEVWYFYGMLTKDEVRAIDFAAGRTPAANDDGLDESAHVIVTLINDDVVRCTINPLDSGSFPYHSLPWQRRAKQWAGVGVAEQMRTPQKVTNAALRALLNNAGKSAGSQFVVDRTAIRPMDGLWTVTPDKIWEKTEDGPADVRQAFMAIQIPNVTNQLLEIINLGERFAEETTSIPLISQGQSGPSTPDTYGAAKLQDNNANQLLRSIGYAFDDHITEPVVIQFYEWLLLDPEVPDDEKGDFQIDAHGSIALVERHIQDESIGQMASMAASPIYGIDPKKWARLFLKSKRLNADDVMYSEEEQAKLDAAPPPEAPAVTVAKVAQDTALKQLAAKQTTEQQSTASEERIAAAANTLEGQHVQNDAARVEAEQQRTHVDATIRLHQIQAERDLAVMQYANAHRISLDEAKVELAKVTMQLQTERDLNAANQAVDLHKHHNPSPVPPVQAPGRAAPGHAFDQTTSAP